MRAITGIPFRHLQSIPSKTRTMTGLLKWRIRSEFYRLPALSLDAVTSVQRNQLPEVIVDDVCMPPFAGNAAFDDLGAVLRIARHLDPSLICEIGTGHGNLTANLLRHCAAARVVTVNALQDMQSGHIVTYRLSRSEIGRVYRKYGYGERVNQLFVNSLDLDLLSYTPPDSVDLAIVDGCHDTFFVLNDFDKVRPFVRRGGVVLFHDTHPSREGHLKESYHACILLRQRGFDVKWIEDTSWAYWRRN